MMRLKYPVAIIAMVLFSFSTALFAEPVVYEFDFPNADQIVEAVAIEGIGVNGVVGSTGTELYWFDANTGTSRRIDELDGEFDEIWGLSFYTDGVSFYVFALSKINGSPKPNLSKISLVNGIFHYTVIKQITLI